MSFDIGSFGHILALNVRGMMATNSYRTGIIAGLATGALWGFPFLAPRLNADFSPSCLALGRFFFYALVSLIFIIPRWPRMKQIMRPPVLGNALVFGLIGNGLFYLCVSYAVQSIGVAVSSLILGLIPLAVAGMGLRSWQDFRRLRWAFVMVSAGIGLLNYHVLAAVPYVPVFDKLSGLGAALAAWLLWSVFAILNARFLKRNPQIRDLDWSACLGISSFIALCLLLLVSGEQQAFYDLSEALWNIKESTNITFVLSIFGLGIGSSWFANFLWNRASQLLPTSLLGQLIVSETLFALLYGYIYEYRLPLLSEFVAACLLLGGVSLAIRRMSREA